jgi:hypothetical protein
MPVNTVWVLNGNDLALNIDLSQRLILCHLQHEDPTSRKQEKFFIQQKYGCSIETCSARNGPSTSGSGGYREPPLGD